VNRSLSIRREFTADNKRDIRYIFTFAIVSDIEKLRPGFIAENIIRRRRKPGSHDKKEYFSVFK